MSFVIRIVKSAYRGPADSDGLTALLDPANYVDEIRYIARDDGDAFHWHTDPQRALVFDSMVQAIEAAGRYRQAYHVSPGTVTIQPWR